MKGEPRPLESPTDKSLQHRHGGVPEHDFARLSLKPAPVVDFSVNLNPLGYPDAVRDRWSELIRDIERYPSLEGEGVARYLGERFGLGRENVLGANGSTEMIYLIPRALGLKRVAVVSPCYHDYYRASVLAGAEVRRIPLSPGSRFAPPPEEGLAEALGGVEALWLGNPNNPTGTFFPRELLAGLAVRFPGKWLLVDEAFMPFDETWREESLAVPLLLPNVIVIHSLTKFYALAGIRLGGVTGSAEVIETLRRAKEPWTVNSVSDAVAPILLACEDYEAESRELVTAERQRLLRDLGDVDGLTVFPSRTNFLLCRWDREPDLDPLLRRLLALGIFVRDCRNFPGLESGYFRVAVRSPEDNDRLVEGLSSASRS